MMSFDDLLRGWQVNNRVNLKLLEAIPEAQLETPLAKGKSVRSQFTHIHNVRLMFLETSKNEKSLEKLDYKKASHAQIGEGLKESAEAMEAMLRRCLDKGKMSGYKAPVPVFIAYAIAHEAHHRGQIEIALRQSGVPLDDKVAYGLWEWDRI